MAAKAAAYLAEHGHLTVSAISVLEVIYGYHRVRREDRIERFQASLTSAVVLPLDDAAARLAGRILADLERRGRPIGMPDAMIAAIAIHHGLPVVTGNVTHFEEVRTAGYALDLEDWRQA